MKVAVIGTGTLGPSIAQVFSQCSEVEKVFLCKGRSSSQRDGMDSIKKSLSRLTDRGKLTEAEANLMIEKICPGALSAAAEADLVVEAVAENLEVKRDIFCKLDKICDSGCIFTTNTSSLPIKAIREGLSRPMAGMHFFNPAPVMKLVEVVAAEDTPQLQIDFLCDIAKKIGKTPVVVKEAPRIYRESYFDSDDQRSNRDLRGGNCIGGGY